jgi:hypothetical protein
MSTVSAGSVLAEQMSRYKQKQPGLADTVKVLEPAKQLPIIIKPTASSWEALEAKLEQVINLPGLWITVRQLYEAGQGAELETAAEIALAKAKKSRFNMFATMISKRSGNWETKTLQVVHDTWEVRRNAVEVMERLKLPHKNVKAILALSWRLRGSIIRFLGIATEQGTKIRNPAGYFFALTKQPKPNTT